MGVFECKRKEEVTDMIVVATDTVPARPIVKTIGAVEAKSSFFVLNMTKSAQRNLEKKASEAGANAIIGFKTEKVSGVVHAKGTAVVVGE